MTHPVELESDSIQKTSWVHQFGLFISVGAICATMDVGIMHALLQWNTSVWVATSAGFVVGLVINFFAHARMTFRTTTHWYNWWRFLLVVGLNYLLTLGCVGMSTWWIDSPLAGKLVSLPLVAINGFVLSRMWIFK